MKNLFVFVWRNYYFFLFLLLEVFSFTLLIRHNNYQHADFINFTTRISGNINQSYQDITDYFNLKKVNKQLAEENTRLHAQTLKSFIIENMHETSVKDTVYKQQFQYLTAKVICNTVNKATNYILINKGSKDGIQRDMGVITSEGVVGVVKDVSENFSYVISVLNKKLKVSARIKRNNQCGSITWNGADYHICTLEDIPSHAIFKKGDLVISSGNSLIFPEGIPIGTITDYEIKNGESFYVLKVKLAVDFNSLNYVYIVKNLMKDEQVKLINATKDE